MQTCEVIVQDCEVIVQRCEVTMQRCEVIVQDCEVTVQTVRSSRKTARSSRKTARSSRKTARSPCKLRGHRANCEVTVPFEMGNKILGTKLQTRNKSHTFAQQTRRTNNPRFLNGQLLIVIKRRLQINGKFTRRMFD